jgi:hypothetical protein
MKHLHILIGIGSAVLMAATGFPLQATADEEVRSQYEFVVVGNRAFGDLISGGDYQLAIDRIKGRPDDYPYDTATNMCVALSLLGQPEQAALHCDRAIELAEASSRPRPRHWQGRQQVATRWAVAYSNRGVLRALRGDPAGAEEDFRIAVEHKSAVKAPTQNFARVQMEPVAPVVASVSR